MNGLDFLKGFLETLRLSCFFLPYSIYIVNYINLFFWILNQLCIPMQIPIPNHLLSPYPTVTVMDMYSNSGLRRIWFVQGLRPLRNEDLGHKVYQQDQQM